MRNNYQQIKIRKKLKLLKRKKDKRINKLETYMSNSVLNLKNMKTKSECKVMHYKMLLMTSKRSIKPTIRLYKNCKMTKKQRDRNQMKNKKKNCKSQKANFKKWERRGKRPAKKKCRIKRIKLQSNIKNNRENYRVKKSKK